MATLKGIFPNPKPTRRKNFIQENVKNLRKMEQYYHSKEAEDIQKIQLPKKTVDRYQNVAARINSSFKSGKSNSLGKPAVRHSDKNFAEDCQLERKVSAPMAGKSCERTKIHRSPMKNGSNKSKNEERADKAGHLRRSPSNLELSIDVPAHSENHENDIKYKSQAIQTLEENKMGTLYKEGVIRYPSGRSSNRAASPGRNTEKSPQREHLGSPLEKEDSFVNISKLNSDWIDSTPVNGSAMDRLKSSRQKTTSKTPSQEAPSNYRKGVVPKYIRERKEMLQQKEEKLKAAAVHPDCPDGHVPLPDEERKETLQMLRKHHQEYVKELNMMPIRTDTLRSQRRKMEIEKQLTKLEEGIKVFSRPRVYVKVNS